MISRLKDNNQESDYPHSEEGQYEDVLYQFIELCSKHNFSKSKASSFLLRLTQEIAEMSVSDYNNELADTGYQKEPKCYFHFVDDPNATHYDPDKHTVCPICAVKLWEIAKNSNPFEFALRDSRVIVALIEENDLGSETDE